MSAKTEIIWTNATVNFWWGCTKVGPGCDFCYAETWDKRLGGNHWGVGVPRRKIAGAVKAIRKLNSTALNPWVFVDSMSDLFDLEVDLAWFSEAWTEIVAATNLKVQIVTKRISAVEKRLAEIGASEWPRHAGLIISVVNQAEANRDIPRLIALKKKLNIPWVGISAEPLLGPLDLTPWLADLDWVIAGGESGPKARPPHPDWFRALRDQCAAAGVPFLFKQWGEWASAAYHMGTGEMIFRQFDNFDQWVGKASTWVRGGICLDKNGTELRNGGDFMAARDAGLFPVTIMHRIGSKAAGNLLDGRQHLDFPHPEPVEGPR